MMSLTQIRQISPQDLETLGAQDIAYVKPEVVQGTTVYAIHAADGTRLAVMPERDQAFAAIKQNEMEAASIH